MHMCMENVNHSNRQCWIIVGNDCVHCIGRLDSVCFILFYFVFVVILQSVDLPGLSFGQQDYYPYVFFKLNLNLLEK